MSDLTRCDDQGVPKLIQSMYLTSGPIYYYFKATLFNGFKRDYALTSILIGKQKGHPLTGSEWAVAQFVINNRVRDEFRQMNQEGA